MEIDSFGGFTTLAPAHLLFAGEKLIVLKIEVESATLSDAADIVKAMQAEFGKPKLSRSKPFTTHTWKRGSATLLLERTSRSWDDNDLTVIMRDESAFKSFQSAIDHNSKEIEKLDDKATRRSITD